MASAWESDARPLQPCVVCSEPPQEIVDLPTLPEVHVVFGSSTLCSACGALARSGDAEALATRGRTSREHSDDADHIDDAVRLVMEWAGHRLPLPPAPPEDHRHTGPTQLSRTDDRLWRRLLPLMLDGPTHPVAVHGVVTRTHGAETTTTEVFLQGRKLRLVGENGEPLVISDGVTVWSAHDGAMVATAYVDEGYLGERADLVRRRTRTEVELFGFGTPIGPFDAVTVHGRPAWRFRFAAPPHKRFDMHVVVDDGTGLVLEKRFGDHSLARWTSFDTDVAPADELFTWTGPTRTFEQLHAHDEVAEERNRADRALWFATHVTGAPLAVAGEPVEVLLHAWDDDGSFQASLSGGELARRRRSDRWWALGWSGITAKWSDDTWDWAFLSWDEPNSGSTSYGVEALRRWLSAGPVT